MTCYMHSCCRQYGQSVAAMGLGLYSKRKKVLVIGCGVVGLNTALRIQKDMPEVVVTIMAEQLAENVVSNVAAGFFRATTSIRGPTPELTKLWIKEAWNYWSHLLKTTSPKQAGIFELPTYLITSDAVPKSSDLMATVTNSTRPCTKEELELFQPEGKYVSGKYTMSVLISPDYYLPWAKDQFTRRNGTFIQRRINSWEELVDEDYDVVVNCTGLGAKTLCNDTKMSPLRGQVIRVRAPWIKFAVFADNDTYIVPGMDYVTLGGCRQYDDYLMEVRENDSNGIWERTTTLVPSLKKAEIVFEAVGLRPFRTCIRVEKEEMEFGDRRELKVVHHYGHCGYGVMTSPGSAVTVSKLTGELLRGNPVNNHLLGAKL